MRWLVGLCVRYAGTLATLTLIALLAGLWATRSAPLDVFPDFVPSTVDIQTEAPGFTAQQVEQLITKPIENAVNGAPGLATLRSESIPGLSLVTIQFRDNIDLYNARQGIAERLSEMGSTLPSEAGTPRLSPLTSSTMDLLKIGLLSDKLDSFELRDRAEWVMKPALLAVPGVAHVIIFGGAVREIQIQPDITKMASYGFTLTDLADAARAALALRGAGFVDLAHQRVLIQSPVPAPDPAAVRGAVLAVRGKTPVTIGDVATVSEARALRSGDAVVMGKPGVLLSLASQYGANTLETTRTLEEALAQLTPALKAEGITVYPALHRPANFIERALGSLEQSLVIAAILILAVLYLFLRDWRSALITFLAIPLSLLAAVAVLERMGQSLNTMTLGGFAVALGVLVDDAIIGIENILRRLAENAKLASPRARLQVIAEATLEVRGPVVYATLVVIAIFLPQLFSTTVEGKFVGPLALAFILAVLASLLVALTAAPALSALMLNARDTHGDQKWILWLKERQRRVIGFVYRRLRLVGAILIAVTLAAGAALPFLGGSFMPDFREGHFVMQVSASTPGASLEEMMAMGERVSKEVLELPYVATIEQQVGRAALGEDTWGPHQSEFHVELKPDADVDQDDAEEALRGILSHYPGLQSEVVTFLGDRISESLTGETADIAVKVFGDQLDTLDATGKHIADALRGTPGIADLQFKPESGTPTFALQIQPQALVANGLKMQDVLDAVQTQYAGATVGQTYAGTRIVNVTLLLPERARNRPELLSSLTIASPFGPVPLSQVARVAPTETRFKITHDGGQRFVSLTFNVVGRALQATEQDAQARVAALKLPPGIYVEFTGAAAEQRAAETQTLLYTAFAVALIGLILFICFQWRANTWLVLVNLPFSLIGAVAGIALTGGGLSVGAMVGLVTVFGVSARNAILLLAHYEHLVEAEGAPWEVETILRGAQERLVPILMTASVTALGLLPLAIGMHQPGQEIEGPMAVTVLGGLISSTLLNLVVLPALAERFGGPGHKDGHQDRRQEIAV
ncbi:MAG TPA: efflux RND transporter permease subunit [Rhizomicrobium sp.]|nr:efflux RND transporter permease subunit [Rhizomicrobium sp.]